MLDHLDNLLRKLFVDRIDEITSDVQVRFQPPDEDWRNLVKNLTVGGNLVNSLNVYLVDLRENRKLRTNERVREYQNGDVFETAGPRRVDCHYLISAWSPADMTLAIEPTLDEHALLVKVATVLANADPLVPVEVYAPAAPPQAIADEQFPVTLLPVEGFLKLPEFWGTMGEKHRWKPVVYVVITIPLLHEPHRAGPPVTTSITEIGVTGAPATFETLFQIGGIVRNTAISPPASVAGAWVELMDAGGVRVGLTRTDAEGRFVFIRLRAGGYRLRASMAGLGVTPIRSITVPEPSGEYDLSF